MVQCLTIEQFVFVGEIPTLTIQIPSVAVQLKSEYEDSFHFIGSVFIFIA